MTFEEITISGGGEDATEKQELHLVNCKLGEDRENMPISKYFTSQLKLNSNVENIKAGANNLKVSFRGRPLNGKMVLLPENYTFARVSKSENKKQLVANDLTKEATYWNLDKLPSGSDVLPQVIQWLKLSNNIHAHVQLEEWWLTQLIINSEESTWFSILESF